MNEPWQEAVASAMRGLVSENGRLRGENERMKAALREIAEHDYRGPRPSESVIAQAALDALYSDEKATRS